MEEEIFRENTENEEIETAENDLDMEKAAKEKLKNLNTLNQEMVQNVKEIIREQEGQNFNIVFANTIQDSSFWGNTENREKKYSEDEKRYCLTQEEEFLLFMYDKKNSCLRLYLLMLLGARIIEVNNLNHYMEQIRLHIGWNKEEPIEDLDLPFSKVCHLLGVEQMAIQKRTKAGMMVQEAIGYTEENVRKLRKIFWRNYVSLRAPLIQWLAEVNEGKQYPGAVLAGIGLADFAQIDFAFIYDRVIAMGTDIHSEAQVYCMARIMENTWEIERYRNNVRHLLHHWMEQSKSQAWLISLVCYLSNINMVDRDKLQKCLKRKIEIFSIEQRWAGFLILKAHQNLELCRILYDALAELYVRAESKVEKKQVCLQFLTMLFVEGCVVSEKGGDLVFVQALRGKERVEKQKPMMLLIWRTLEYRRLLQNILDGYFSDLGTGFDENNLKNFIMMLAFTGRKTDFENMEVYLMRKSGCGNAVTKVQLYREIQELFMQRKIGLEAK